MASKTEEDVRKEYNESKWGELLLSIGFDPYNTESSARMVARSAAEKIEVLEKTLKYSEELCLKRRQEIEHMMESQSKLVLGVETQKKRMFLEGFKASGEGYNGEYLNGNDVTDETIWKEIERHYEELKDAK